MICGYFPCVYSIIFRSMDSEHYVKPPSSKAAAMEMRRMSLMRPIPSNEANKTSQKSMEPATFRSKIQEVLNGLPYNICISILTIYVLFADDFRQVFFPPSADLPFTILVIICMAIYFIEILLNIYTRNEYFLSFFFWLDVISTGTMVFDLMWINVGGSAGVATNIVQIARAGKASRIGARSARMIRIVKLIKMVQQYKTAKQQISSEQGKQVEGLLDGIQKKGQENERPQRRRGLAVIDPMSLEKAALDSPQNLHQEMMKRAQDRKSTKQVKLQTYSQIVDLKETRVGIKLKEQMETNTTMMIMLVLLSVPLLSSTTWFAETTIYEDSINQLDYFMMSGADNYTRDAELSIFINQSLSLRTPLVYLDFPVNSSCCNFPRDFPSLNQGIPALENLRASSTVSYTMGNITVVYDTTSYDIFTAQLNIGRTLFVCVLLIISSLLFSQDVEDYLLEPLESMLVTVKRISADPLKAIIALENEKLIKQTIRMDVKEEVTNQPAILENMIVKIGSLLVVGFGEAGSQIIAKNIQAHGAINPVLSGTKMIAIFGFCDIRNFTDATEVLQTGVMNFVNDIAEIVHGIVNKCGGSANKNIGDAFLLVWKFKQKEVFLSDSNGKTQVTLRRIKKVSQIADLAVFSFMKIVAELSKAPKLFKYANNKYLKDRIKNFTGVKMGFGLHVGWAIEGAIGSSFKIDASYLSPNVNMASRLQAATKQFGVLMLFSGNVVQLMTPHNQKLLRLIDRVTVKGSIEPIDLYTLDVNSNVFKELRHGTEAEQHIKPMVMNAMQKKKQKMFAYKTRQAILSSIESGKHVTERIFSNDKDFQKMREPYSEEFFMEWARGYDLYNKGSWGQAKAAFQNTLRINDCLIDGPSNTLLQVIESHGGQAPSTWQGYRQLTEK